MVSELDLINVCNILVNIKLLNGVCPQSPCTGCQQFAPPQSVVLTLPVPQNRLPASMMAQATGPCCQNGVQSMQWTLNQPAWNSNGAPGPIPTGQVNYQNAIYAQGTTPTTPRPATRPYEPQYTSGSPQGDYNYNNLNGATPSPGYSTPAGSYNGQNPNYGQTPGPGQPGYNAANYGYSTPSPLNNGGYNTGNQGYSTPGPAQNGYNANNQGYSTPGVNPGGYNDGNPGYSTPLPGQNGYNNGNQGYSTPGVPQGGYNAGNEGYGNQGNGYNGLNAGGQSGYNGANAGYDGQNPNDGKYTSSFEGTFVGPANGQPNGQGNPQQQLGYNELNAGNQQQIGGQQPNGQPILYPTPEFNQPGQPGQQVNAGGVYQGSANGQPNGNGQYMDQTQSPYNYNTVHPNSGYDASAQYPVTGTAAGNGQSSPTAFQYTTPYNPNNQNQQFTTASPSQFNDPQYQTTSNSNYGGAIAGGALAGAAAGAGAGLYAGGQTTTQYPSSSRTTGRPTTAGSSGRTTTTKFGQDQTGQFVQGNQRTTNNGQGRPSTTTFPTTPTTFTTTQRFPSTQTTQGYPQTSSYNNQQFDTQGQQQFSDGPALTANHADMNYQYSKGVDGGSTLVPQMMGSTQPYSLQQTQRQNTGATASTIGGVGTGTNNRLYDHGDMNAQYGQYDTTNTANGGGTIVTTRSTNDSAAPIATGTGTVATGGTVSPTLRDQPSAQTQQAARSAAQTLATVMATLLFFFYL